MNPTKSKTSDWRKVLFIVVAVTLVLSLLLAACTPAVDLEGTSGKGKGNGNDNEGKGGDNQGKGGGNDNEGKGGGNEDKDKTPKNTPKPTDEPKGQEKNKKITLCHATGSATNPYVKITVADDGVYNGHIYHDGDIIPAPAGGCPKPENPTKTPKVNKKITICHATGSAKNPYVKITVADDGVYNGHIKHEDDIIPAPAGGCTTSTETPTETPTETETPDPTPTPPPSVDVTPSPLCEQLIVFHTFRTGDLEIFRLDGVEGSPDANLINLSNSSATDSRPSRFPNDSQIVFQSDRNGNVELYLGDMQGKSQSRLTETESNNINAMAGPDNQHVIYQSDRNGNWDIYIVDVKSGVETQLTEGSWNDENPFWSPWEDWITFQSDRDGSWNIYALNVDTGNVIPVTEFVGVDSIFPAWSPNGAKISFLSNLSGAWDLFVSNWDGSELEQITTDGGAGNATWSPEGYRIAYQVDNGESVDVYTYDLVNQVEYQLTEFAGPDSAPTWDCGGGNVAFTSLLSGNPDIFSVPWQGGEISEITNHPSTDKWSEWSPSKEPASRGY